MVSTFQGLLANLGIISVLLGTWSLTFQISLRLTPDARSIAMVAAGGVCAILLMSVPIELLPGVILDLRAIPIALAGYFGGPIVGAAVGVIAALFRVYLGGVGAPAAVIGIGILTTLGILMGWLCRRHRASILCLLLVSGLTAPASVIGTLFLPPQVRGDVIAAIVIPGMIACFVGMLLVSAAIVNELRRLKIAAQNQLYRSLMDAFPEPLNGKDAEGRFIAANPATADLMHARTSEELIGKTDFDFYPAPIAAAFRNDEEQALAGGKPTIVEQHVERRDGSTAWISTLKAPLVDLAGLPLGFLTHNRDITELKQLRDEQEQTRAQLADALASMADGLAVFDRDNRLVLCNERYKTMFPRTANLRVPGARLRDLLMASFETGDIVNVPAPIRDAWLAEMMANRHSRHHDLVLGDGRTVTARVQPGNNGSSVVVISDVTDARKAEKQMADLNAQLGELARTDSLTGVANRRVFDETIAAAMQRSARAGSPLSLLLLDIDLFKAFNDREGHMAGDECLREVAKAITSTVTRPGDVVARYGGEEFAVVLPDTDESGARITAERIRSKVEGVKLDGITFPSPISVSIGVATISGFRSSAAPSPLILAADSGLYQAKREGRNRVVAGFVEPTRQPSP